MILPLTYLDPAPSVSLVSYFEIHNNCRGVSSYIKFDACSGLEERPVSQSRVAIEQLHLPWHKLSDVENDP